MEYDPGTMTSEVRQAFLVGICTATDMCTVLSGLEMYSQEADQQPQLYSAVLQRLASTPGAHALPTGACHHTHSCFGGGDTDRCTCA